MSEPKLTPWFPASVKPARPGVYNVSCREREQTGRWYGRFDGRKWYGSWGNSPDDRVMYPYPQWTSTADGTPATWRGLAEKPQ